VLKITETKIKNIGYFESIVSTAGTLGKIALFLHYSIEFYIVNLFSVAAKLADFPVPIS
jgi:hypothetical protein